MKQIVFSVVLMLCATVVGAAELLPMEKALKLNIVKVETDSVQLRWDIADGYFLFDNRLRVQSQTTGIKIGDLAKPAADSITDAHFGALKIYRQQLLITIPLEREDKAQNELNLGVTFQGCHSTTECYPLQNLSLHFALPALDVKQSFDFPDQADDFLEPELAFLFSAELVDNSYIVARWKIADGYYLYRKQLSFSIQNAPQVLGELEIPDGEMKEDDYFGRVEVYFKTLEVNLPLKNLKGLNELVLNVGYRGCADGGLCYPAAQKQQTFPLQAPKAEALDINQFSSSNAYNNGGGLSAGMSSSFGEDNFLSPEEAFQLDVSVEDTQTLIAHWQIADNYYVYRDKLKFELLQGGQLSALDLPAGKTKEDPQYGAVEVYYHQFAVRLPIVNAAEQIKISIQYQGCADAGLCYPPETKVLDINMPTAEIRAAPVEDEPQPAANENASVSGDNLSEQDQIQKFLGESNVFVILAAFFGFGLLLALTPCVFPMIPILSGIIVGQGKDITARKGFIISLVYVLAMALTYTVAGVVAGLLGANLQIAFQNPWLLSAFALIFILLALSMFGFYELQLPSALQSKINEVSNRQAGGTFIGVAIMGLLSALIVGPCIAPPLAGALMFISSTGNAVLGGAALFFMSLGMGVPLLLIGISAGKLLPRAGTWMDVVKYVFGVLLLAVAIWMLERVLPAYVTMLMWAALLIISAVYMGALDKVEGGGWHKLWKGLGFLLLIYGVLLVIGVARGHYDVFKPLAGLAGGGNGSVATASSANSHTLNFQPINSLAELDAAVAKASAQGKPAMLDFYADWCIACKELESLTFSDPEVQTLLADYQLLQADVTAYNEDHKALLKHFNLYGPPGIIFYNRQGVEQSATRVVGFKNASDFTRHLKQLP